MQEKKYVLFQGNTRLKAGGAKEIRNTIKGLKGEARIAIYDLEKGRVCDLDDEISPAKKVGRPKLGVVCKEVSLLPRHWGWLSAQRGGASATIRRLVDDARKSNVEQDALRKKVNRAHAFIWDLAGQEVGFEEACRALFAHDFESFAELISAWPKDVQLQTLEFLEG